MKIKELKILVGVAFVLSAAFASCGGEGGGSVKLLESMTSDGAFTYKYEYDDKNRLVKSYFYYLGNLNQTRAITYVGDDLVTVEDVYEENPENNGVTNIVVAGNRITFRCSLSLSGERSYILTVNKAGQITSSESSCEGGHRVLTFQYRGGNLVKSANGAEVAKIEYDDKKSPLYHSRTPKWLLQHYFSNAFANKNNAVDAQIAPSLRYVTAYEYDSDGFPVRQTTTVIQDGEEVHSDITTFTYRGGAAGEFHAAEDEIAENFYDPHFDIYGAWVATASAFIPSFELPEITINSDNTVSAFSYHVYFEGAVTGTNTHQIRVHIASGGGDGVESVEPHDWILTYNPATKLMKRGEVYYRKKTEREFFYNAEFNDNEMIAMTVFWSLDEDNEFFPYKVDSLHFVHDDKMLSAVIDMSSELFRHDDEPNFGLILVDDYNFDGYLDVAVLSNRGVSNAAYNYFIRHPRTQSFHRSETLSGLTNASFDKETKTVVTYNVSGAGRYYSAEEYKWDGVELTLFRTVSQQPNDDDVIIRVTRTLRGGEWTEESETVEMDNEQ